ncbi:MAG: glycine cleavage system aminomethyltransferase GcvT [Spirochaetota bacterium]|nr:glycine cleavage system aminomethyltransferase GcvT [Spirochaetota bacterium]
MLKRTPLYDVYRDYEGVKIVEFGGWELPVQFSEGIIKEHLAVRKNAGLFDVSHMGEIIVEGPGSEAYIDWLVTNDVKSMEDYQCLYSPMCYPDGGVVDDLLIYRYSPEKYLLVVNASNSDKDYEWITRGNPKADSPEKPKRIENLSSDFGQLAFQGPMANQYMREIVGDIVDKIGFFHFTEGIRIAGHECIVSRTGYTGEDGFEIYCSSDAVADIWNELLDRTADKGVLPCGLGARDTLRFESKLPLYGHELTKDISPLEANLSVFVHLEGDDFCGKEALSLQKEKGVPRSLRGCEMIDRGVPREHYRVFSIEGEEIGVVTSGSKSIMLDKFCGLVLIQRGIGLKVGDEIEIEINNKRRRARLVKTPFYKNTQKK